ncbi:Tripartite tricarboxylate transporter TctB family protein [Sphaerochaeta associata]|uniref:Tripartite tricarboxylate transporter TctB family protein n=1 Tax=Sphaerochaeta associata TaxID=1129264 RepID=A0ABY4D8D9_9SPIR|nr:tripartite tricarboxylate transporter TctB family protein [Sphaerochaeta associata]UOM50543.1 tripartite tricarboxylate transporter TctB family protein [Sphaerochaeta associata]SMP40608.1 Tripartite tricarboxylate transporter TctB family protein [Sphaerochaeta associata]
MKKNITSDFWVGLGAILFGIFVFVQSKKLPQAKMGIGPGDYPAFVAIIIISLGLIQAVKALLANNSSAQTREAFDAQRAKKVFLLVSGTFAYVFMMKFMGFLLLSPFFLLFLFWMFGYSNRRKAIVISITVSVVIYFLFMYAFQVLLPRFSLF